MNTLLRPSADHYAFLGAARADARKMVSLGTKPDLDVAQLGMLGPDLVHPNDDLDPVGVNRILLNWK